MRRAIFFQRQSPGDVLILSMALRQLHQDHPGQFLTDVRTPCPEIFEGNPHITPLSESDPGVEVINVEYPTIHQSSQRCVHFANSMATDLANKLNVKIGPVEWTGSIYIRDEEKAWLSAVYEILGRDVPYVVLDAGCKQDFTIKQWSFARHQEVVDRCPDIYFVQVGHASHIHPPLKGPNLINMVGKTDLRQLIRLIYNSYMVVTPVSLPMVLSFAIPPCHRWPCFARPCVVIAGARESSTWQMGPNTQFLHTCGALSCAQPACWKSRIKPLGDGDNKDSDLCLKPVELPDGQVIARCMDMISADQVVNAIRMYYDNLEY